MTDAAMVSAEAIDQMVDDGVDMTAFIREETPCMPNQYGKKRVAPFAAAQREVWDFESS